jgi:hypothetical protein
MINRPAPAASGKPPESVGTGKSRELRAAGEAQAKGEADDQDAPPDETRRLVHW